MARPNPSSRSRSRDPEPARASPAPTGTASSGGKPSVAFTSIEGLRAWLASHHAGVDELVIRCFKTHASRQGVTYRQALDEALCFGWIDGVRHALDADSFTVRFTPRRSKSIWSAVNIRRAGELESEGRMRAAGLAAFHGRDAAYTKRYSFESKPVALGPAFEKKFRARRGAWEYFEAQAPWYRRTSSFWVMSAKREATRLARLEVLISHSAEGKPIPLLDRTPVRGTKPR